MLEGSDIPQSDAWWVKILARELQDRRHGRTGSRLWSRGLSKPQRIRPGIDLLHDHLVGDPPLLGVADGWKDSFREVARIGRLNVASLVIEAKANRMPLRGFRTAAAGDELGDQQARDLMRANDLKVRGREVIDHMLALGDGYTMVTPPSKTKWSLITAEDPRECITAHDPATGETRAALKAYRDEWDSADFIHLFVTQDDGSVRHRIARRKSGVGSFTASPFRLHSGWEWVESDDEDTEPVTLPRMPIIRHRNRRGVGEYEWHLDTIDRINDQILDKLVIAKIQAFRQQAIKGLPDSERKLVDGKIEEVEINYDDAFVAAPGSLWQLPAGVELWESTPTDLRPLLEAIKDDLEHFAAVTATPLHTITPDAAEGSAEGASLMREEHVYAVESCRDHAEIGWVETMATAFAFMEDDERGDKTQLEAIWGPSERYSLSERASAASQAGTSLPREAIQRDIWQYDPAEIPNLRQLGGRDLLGQVNPAASAPLAPAFQPPALPQPPAAPPVTPPTE